MLFKNKKTLPIIIFLLIAICLFSFLGEFFLPEEHGHHGIEVKYGFHAAFGFAAFVVIVFLAKWFVRPLVSREEDFYE